MKTKAVDRLDPMRLDPMRPRRVYEEEDEETEGGLSSRRQQDFIVGNDKALLAARLLIIASHLKMRRHQMEMDVMEELRLVMEELRLFFLLLERDTNIGTCRYCTLEGEPVRISTESPNVPIFS